MKAPAEIKVSVLISKGKFASNLPLIKDIVKTYEGLTIDITFKKRTNKRSNPQNKYYFGLIVPIFQDCIRNEWGEIWGVNKTHEFLKANCNYDELVNEETGQIVRVIKSTTENTTTNQEIFHEKCRLLALEFFNTDIPLPEQQIEIKL